MTSIGGRDPTTGEPITVTIEDGRIASVGPGPADETAWLCAGLVDLQVNGFMGHDVNAHSVTAVEVTRLAVRLARAGVTCFAPTLITAHPELLLSALRAIAQARRDDRFTAHAIPMIHVEGPHLSPEDGPRGAHPLDAIRPPDTAELDRWQEASGGLIGIVTLSPHWPGVAGYIEELRRRGIRASIGHTHATPAQITAAVDAGASLSTHLGNGSHALLPRHPNYLWSQLADDRLTASFIADGHHLPAAALKAMLRAKTIALSFLVSDSVALAGMPPGRYEASVGGRVELSADGRLSLAGTPFLAGAAKPLIDDVAIAVRLGGITLGDAIAMATINPGRIAGGRGEITVGAPADLLRFRWSEGDTTLGIEQVLVQGLPP